jgi:hypothetical protein
MSEDEEAYWEGVDEGVKTLLGHRIDRVQAEVEGGGWDFRVTQVDGKPRIITCDVKQNRINVRVTEGIVIEAWRG